MKTYNKNSSLLSKLLLKDMLLSKKSKGVEDKNKSKGAEAFKKSKKSKGLSPNKQKVTPDSKRIKKD